MLCRLPHNSNFLCAYLKLSPGLVPGDNIGGGGGTAGPYLSIRAGLYLHPVARMRGVLFAAPGF